MLNFQRRQLLALSAVVGLSFTLTAHADDPHDANAIVDKARLAFDDMIRSKGYESLRSGLKTAKGVLVFPSIIKGGVVVGGSGGTGVLLVRGEGNTWSAPAFYTLGAVSVGLQIGGQAAEVVVLVNSQKGIDRLLTNSVKLSGDVSAAVGPVGKGKAANLAVDFISYAKSKGAFLGMSVEGSVLDVRDSLNHGYYGKSVTAADILVKQTVANKQADALRAAVTAAAH